MHVYPNFQTTRSRRVLTTRPGAAPRAHVAGFTAVELVIVAAIVGILALAAALQWRNQVPAYALDRAQHQVATALASARMRAVSQNMPVQVAIDPVAAQCAVWCDSNTNGTIDDVERDLYALDQLSDHLRVTVNGTNASFDARGTFTASNGFWDVGLLVTNTDLECHVHVFPSGQIVRSEEAL